MDSPGRPAFLSTLARAALAEFFRPHGVEVVEATDGAQLLGQVTRNRLNGEPLDAIVMELRMPRLGGIDALRRIRAVDPQVAVMILTGAMEPALHRQAQMLGASAIFMKPAHLPALWAAIEGHVTAPRRATQSHVLIVDDDAEVRETFVEFLERRGYQTSTAEDGTGAVQALMRQPADVVLLDVHMPGLSGVDALPTLRAIAPRAAVIMVTANVDLHIAKRTLAHGAFDYLVKPVNFAHLAQSIEMAMEMKALDPDSAP